jgi:hypothetical protein
MIKISWKALRSPASPGAYFVSGLDGTVWIDQVLIDHAAEFDGRGGITIVDTTGAADRAKTYRATRYIPPDQ